MSQCSGGIRFDDVAYKANNLFETMKLSGWLQRLRLQSYLFEVAFKIYRKLKLIIFVFVLIWLWFVLYLA